MLSRKVLLIGWDAADWKIIQPLMAAGKMPNIQTLVSCGAAGSIATLHPPLSPMLWTSIATGKRPFQHGIHGFAEPEPDGSGVRPVTNLSRKSKALWNILNQNGLRSVVIGWWPSHPAEPIDGVMVSDQYHRARGPLEQGWELPPDTVHPPELAETLSRMRVHPERLDPSLVERFIPLACEIDQDVDRRLAAFLRTLAECMSIQAAAAWLIDNRPWDFFGVYFEAIDHFCHTFMRYHPPRQSWIGKRDFELYGNVVSMAYQFHDQMLGELLQRAGGDTTVILMSDHGFHPDHLRPSSIPDIPAGPAIEHRGFGIFAIRGAGIRKGESIHSLSLLDVTPTILTVYDLPVGEDMDGKVLSQAFVNPPQPAFVPSWEEIPGADGRHPPHTRLDPVATHLSLEQMVALGYIERPDENREIAVRNTIRELRYNLGESYQDAGRHRDAYGIFREIYNADRDEQRFAVRLFLSCQALGLQKEMQGIVDDLDGRRRSLFEQATTRIDELQRKPGEAFGESERRELARWRNLARYHPAVTEYLKAQVLIARKRYAEALDKLQQITEGDLRRPGVLLEIADLHLRLGHEGDAQQLYEKALALDPDDVRAYIGLSRLALRRRKYQVAAHLALDALQRAGQDPLPHFLLGRALAGLKAYERAAEAFRAAIAFNPNFPEAHERLAALLEKHLCDLESAQEHRRLAHGMRCSHTSAPPLAQRDASEASFLSPPPGLHPPSPDFSLSDSLVVVTGLPRSGTSLMMQMLAEGGLPILSDGLRAADEDNPRGYFEFEPVKRLLKDSKWLFQARGKAIKIVAPLLHALPPNLGCRVILCLRDLDEVLDSQKRMLQRRLPAAEPGDREMLRAEYIRTLNRVKAMLARRPNTRTLMLDYRMAVSNPCATAEQVNHFLGGGLDETAMVSAVDPGLHRNRTQPAAR
jgi:predicted AlkP superfamily phosphohydrolase/phosphomutase/tetratricopeptide (TPR) repeat protein